MKTCRNLTLLLFALNTCFLLQAQDLGNIKTQKPFTWQGSIGASLNFYSSTEKVYTQPPYAWNVYGNFTGNLYGVTLPVSFLVNQYGKSYTNPFTQFGISPTYKWIKLHLGYRNMVFSPLTYEGQSFKGAGIELTPGIFRFAAFAGKLNKSVNEDTTSGRLTMPQFSRKGYGVKIGIGNSSHFFDLIYFSAKDDSSSAKVLKSGSLRPQENSVLGSSAKITLLKKIILTTDVALSGLTQDIGIEKDSTEPSSLSKFFDRLIDANGSTALAWAGQTLVTFQFNKMQATIGYRRVQPDFKSLGTPYMLNDLEQLSLTNHFSLSKGKLNINTSIGSQHNNLNNKLISELKTTTANVNVNSILSSKFSLNLNGTFYGLHQKDGLIKVNDSFRLKQQVLQFSISPVYLLASSSGNLSLSANLTAGGLFDQNPATDSFNSNRNFSASATAAKYINQKALNFSLTALHNRFTQGEVDYNSTGFNLGAGTQLLKSKNLSLQGTVGYLFNNYQSTKTGGNITFSFNAGYQAGKQSFSAFTNYLITTPGNIITNPEKIPVAVSTKNFAGGLSYSYSF